MEVLAPDATAAKLKDSKAVHDLPFHTWIAVQANLKGHGDKGADVQANAETFAKYLTVRR